METVTKNINAPLDGAGAPVRVLATQGDMNTRYVRATLLYGSEAVAIATTATASIQAKRPDGTSKTFAATINSDGTVTAPLTGWMLEQVGNVLCNISIYTTESGAQKRLTSMGFIVVVGDAANDGGSIEQDTTKDVLLTLIDTTNAATAAANKATSAANTATTNATTATDRANAAAEACEGIAAQNNNLYFAINTDDHGLDCVITNYTIE